MTIKTEFNVRERVYYLLGKQIVSATIEGIDCVVMPIPGSPPRIRYSVPDDDGGYINLPEAEIFSSETRLVEYLLGNVFTYN